MSREDKVPSGTPIVDRRGLNKGGRVDMVTHRSAYQPTDDELKENTKRIQEGWSRTAEMMEGSFIDSINERIQGHKRDGMSVKGVSDGWHTFEELYYHRMVLFSIICNQNKDVAWKSKQHHDGTMFDDESFICGVETPEGQYTYHYKLEHWDKFDVQELEYAPEFDGHQPKDITRLYSLL